MKKKCVLTPSMPISVDKLLSESSTPVVSDVANC